MTIKAPTRRGFVAAGAATTAMWTMGASSQQVFPVRPVRIVVPYTPGGGNDVLARSIAARLSDLWRQPVIVENKAGAAGNIGADAVAKAAGDGYTLLITNNNILCINPALLSQMPFDAIRDFSQISLLGVTPVVLVVRANSGITSVSQLIAAAKSKPGELTYASSGIGSPQHLSAEMFKAMTGTDIRHVPYKGAAPALTDVLGGSVDMQFGAITALLPHLKGGRLIALGVGGTQRAKLLPDVPTIAEAGVRGYDSEIWFGLASAARTPGATIQRINEDVAHVLGEPAIRSLLAEQGIDARTNSPKDMERLVAADLKRWTGIIKSAGIKPE